MQKLKDGANKLKGNKDALEAVCASSALVASADGEISDDEIKTTVKVVSSHPTLSSSYKTSEIEKCVDAMLKRAQAGRTGRMGLYKEIEQIKASHDTAETVYLCALDVAESNGSVDAKERDALNQIAKTLGLNPSNYASV